MRNIARIFLWFLIAALSPEFTNTVARGASARQSEESLVMDLSGEWEFKLDPLDLGRNEKWFDGHIAYDRKIHVPGAWNAEGVAFESEEQLRAYDEKRRKETKALDQLGVLGGERESGRLFHTYPGPGWYRKQVGIPADWNGKIPWLVFAGVHREAEVWINGKPAGTHVSYITPFRIDLSPFAKAGDTITIVVRVDARRNRETDPLMGTTDTLDYLYVTWGGIYRQVKLEAVATTHIEDVFILPHLADEAAEVRVAIEGPKTGKLTIAVEILDNCASVAKDEEPVAGGAAETVLTVRIAKPELWSPKSPHLYTGRIRLLSGGASIDSRAVRFGMREFKIAGGKFLLNGQPIFLRGYGEDCIFPNTICPPDDKEKLRAHLALAREYGFNYVRHHSWIPPEKYLDAADELGMMIQPEFPFAYRWDLPTTPEAKRSAIEQWKTVIRLNRNHPSIVAWCMGNELYDSFDLAPKMYEAAKESDPSRPVNDTDGCNFKEKDRNTLDFLVVPFSEGDSIGYQDNKYHVPENINKPVVAHEMGYFATLPDLSQERLFKDGLLPYWLRQARELATRNGVLEAYPTWLGASYRLQGACLKCNVEAARRSNLSGTSVWLLYDYPNCAEGIVDMFGRRKGLSAEEFRKFNSPTVLLLDTPRRNWWSGETAEINFAVSRFEDAPSDGATLRWQLRNEKGVVADEILKGLSIRVGGVQELPKINIKLPELKKGAKFTLSAKLVDTNGKTENSWNFWIFPRDLQASPKVLVAGFDPIRTVYPDAQEHKRGTVPANTRLLITTRLDKEIISYLEHGGRVLLLDPETAFNVERTNFRLSSWDGGGPSGTILNTRHAAFRNMPSEGWCDLQFYSLIQGSKSIFLDPYAPGMEPLVRCIDRSTRLAKRAYLFEVSIGDGKLLVSGFNFSQALTAHDPAGIFLFDQLIRYALGPDFAPKTSLAADVLRNKVAKR